MRTQFLLSIIVTILLVVIIGTGYATRKTAEKLDVALQAIQTCKQEHAASLTALQHCEGSEAQAKLNTKDVADPLAPTFPQEVITVKNLAKDVGIITGYYTFETKDFPLYGTSEKCDQLIVVKKSSNLEDRITQSRIPVRLEYLTADEQNILRSSSQESPVTLVLGISPLEPVLTDQGPCWSSNHILELQG